MLPKRLIPVEEPSSKNRLCSGETATLTLYTKT
jgi:hypothetical protein